jgi:arylsulfatase A-like enzyme
VPLIFYWPGKVAPGVRASEVVGLHQVPATVMDLLGGADSAPLPGESLAGLLTGKAGEMRTGAVLSELSPGRFKSGPPGYPTTGGGLKSLVTDEWHFIVSESGRTELYRWRKDPQEAHNLADGPEARAVVEQLKRQLDVLLTSGDN